MKTYQDLLACGNDEKRRMKFVLEAIDEDSGAMTITSEQLLANATDIDSEV